jgi:hypothetical protein
MRLTERINTVGNLVKQVKDKDALCIKLADKYGKTPLSIKRNWVCKINFL